MKYLVESSFKGMPSPEALALIPAVMARGQELDTNGVREWLLIAADQSKARQLFMAESLEATQVIMESFPLYDYLDMKITPIADAQ